MKVAVTYDNGNVFQHFGRTESFKVYEVENKEIVSSKVVSSNGQGHGALAGVLGGYDVDVLICGGIGGGARAALASCGIEVCAGASGDADEAVKAYLNGTLVPSDETCDHHDHHEDGGCCGHHDHEEDHECCGHHDDGNCCCGNEAAGKNIGKTVKVHYRGTFNDGTQFDSSYDRGKTLDFVCGAHMMIQGFDAAVANMEVGESVDIHLMPEEAYGMPDPRLIFQVPLAQLPGSEQLETGMRVYLENEMGQQFGVTVVGKDDAMITFDGNHEMAGKELNFHIELIEVL
ncbi:MAG: FKBP-type peptidyl-prolyl cis-trans isomerase [Solobacterium sp.]|nr:FKBP-type peptidyl-prolyl cis-trans isomerase [Solobacterium sp.]